MRLWEWVPIQQQREEGFRLEFPTRYRQWGRQRRDAQTHQKKGVAERGEEGMKIIQGKRGHVAEGEREEETIT